jgi:hypothetical protein
MYDVYDLSNHISSSLKIGIQSFHSDGKINARVIAEIRVIDSGSQFTIGTNTSWFAYSADYVFRPSTISQGNAYYSPLENIDGSEYAAIRSWPTRTDLNWSHAVAKSQFSALEPKRTLPITFEEGIQCTKLFRVEPNRYFFDFGEELMGGIRLEIFDASALENNFTLQVTLSEELVNDTSVLYPMRTGNRYRSQFISGYNNNTSHYYYEHHE